MSELKPFTDEDMKRLKEELKVQDVLLVPEIKALLCRLEAAEAWAKAGEHRHDMDASNHEWDKAYQVWRKACGK